MVLIGIGIILLLAAGLFYFLLQRSAALQAASVNWPTAQGTVAESYLYDFRDKDGWTNYMARVKFAYRVEGKEFKSERIAWGGRSYSRDPAEHEAVIARYPVGSQVSVHYNPQKAKQGVLEPAETGGLSVLKWMWIGLAILGAAFCVGGIFLRV